MSMSTDISLHELLDLSIGTPDVGSVNFSALHALLKAMLGHLKIERITTAWRDVDHQHGGPSQPTASSLEKCSPYAVVEERVRRMEEQLSVLECLPSASQLLRSDSGVTDMWSIMQLRRKTQASEDGVSKCMALIQDLLTEIQTLKESRDDLTQKVTSLHGQISQLNMNELTDRITAIEQYCHQVEDLDNTTKDLKEKLTQYPRPEELTQCVTWEVMQAALISERMKIQEGLQNTITISATKDTAAVHPLNQESPIKHDTASTAADTSRRVSPPQQSRSDGALFTVTGRPLSRVSLGAEQYPETVEALVEVGRLRDRHESLEARVEQLEAKKADQTQLKHLSDLLTAMGEREIPDHVPEQLNYLRTLVDSLIADKEKVSELDSVLNMGSSGQNTGSASCQDTHTSQIEQMSQQINHIRSDVQMLMREIEDRVKERNNIERQMQDMQEQLNSLRVILEDMMKCSSSLVSNSQQLEAMGFSKDRGQNLGLGQGQNSDQTRGHSLGPDQNPCQTLAQTQGKSLNKGESLGVDQKLAQFQGQHLDQTQGHGKDSAQGQKSRQVKGQSFVQSQHQTGRQDQDVDVSQRSTHVMNQKNDRSKNTELVNDVQSVMLQLQAQCEKLHNTTSQMMEEDSKKQIHIDHLYKTIEELDKKKANKELVEMEIETKADKRALESKVSRVEFDRMTEQLNNVLQEVLSKISGQEQDWHKVMEKITTEMDCKLNRTELDPLKKQLDDLWRSIHRQLQTPPAPEQDDAAGIRKQLLARFNCLSCDRPVDMMTPGQHLASLPCAPGLPSHKSSRPYTVYELEQVRQHCRSERIPEMADYSYLARSCGGSHTLTYPNHRYTRLQHTTHLIQTEEDSRSMSFDLQTQAEEVNILGLDGHVYKGRMNNRAVKATESRLPTISPREVNCKSKDKVSLSQSQRSSGVDAARGSPARPQSAKTHRSHSASSSSLRDRPMSSMDCLSRPIVLQSSLHDTTSELHKDLNQSEEEPVTSL